MRQAVRLTLAAALLVHAGLGIAGTQTRTSAFEYDPTSGLLVKEIIEPDSPSLCLVTTYTYDTYGNKTGATTRNCNGSTGSHSPHNNEAAVPTGDAVFLSRTSTTSFAATTANPVAGQFPTSSTNALGHTETKEFDPRFGTVTKLTGPNGLSTTWTYDGFGRKSTETRADGTTTSWAYTRCVDSPGTCPTYGVMFVTVTATGSPESRQFLDSLGREIRSETQGFDGTWVRKDTQYDPLGRVAQVSKPYKAGASAAWTTYQYDILGRVVETNEPTPTGDTGGGVRTVTEYATPTALATRVTVSNAGSGTNMPGGFVQTRTTTKNSQGQVVEVKDTQNNTVAYTYDPFGNLLTTNAGGVTTTLTYDLRGRKTTMADPDMGSWSYFYNALGELIRQTDAKSQITTMAYDKLGRMTTRAEPDLTSHWYYDKDKNGVDCPYGKGKLCEVDSPIAQQGNGYNRKYTFDDKGRPSTLTTFIDTSYTVTTTYVSTGAHTGKVDTITYPTGFAVKNLYNTHGYLHKVQRTNDTDTTVYWEAQSQDAAGNVTSELLGNGLTQTRTYDALFRVTAITASNTGGAVHNLAYAFDPIGNVIQRQDLVQAVTEGFAYDALNRLVTASGSGLTTRTFEYNAVGNMTIKSDVGTYTYPALDAARPHAVSSVTGGSAANSITASYTYDANGNLTSSSGTIYPATGSVTFSRTLTYTSFNMPLALTHVQGSATYGYTYTYNAEHERVKLVTVRPDDTITSIYLHPAGRGALLYEKETRNSDGRVEHKHYVNGAGLIGVFVTKSAYLSGEGPEMRYYHKDHLGSIAVITNPAAAVIQQLAYEAFGERRNPDGSAQNRSSPLIGIATDRGFTAHEHLDEMNLIHMNGRVYDPVLGRFITADPFVQSAGNSQSYNRYSYVLNNPLMYTDPSGYFSFRKAVKSIAKPFQKIGGELLNAAKDLTRSILKNVPYDLAQVGVAIGSAFCGPWAPACAAAGTYENARAHGASSAQARRMATREGALTYLEANWNGERCFRDCGFERRTIQVASVLWPEELPDGSPKPPVVPTYLDVMTDDSYLFNHAGPGWFGLPANGASPEVFEQIEKARESYEHDYRRALALRDAIDGFYPEMALPALAPLRALTVSSTARQIAAGVAVQFTPVDGVLVYHPEEDYVKQRETIQQIRRESTVRPQWWERILRRR